MLVMYRLILHGLTKFSILIRSMASGSSTNKVRGGGGGGRICPKCPILDLPYIYISNQKQPSCKKRSAALEKAMVKKDVKSKVAAKKWL